MNITFKSRIKGIYQALFHQGIPFHRDEKYNPFFIMGSGRCGTTLLRRILTAKDGIHIPPENWSLGSIIRKFHNYHWHEDWNTLVDIIVATHCYRTQDWFSNFPNTFVKEVKKCPADKRSLCWLLDSLYRYHAKESNIKCNRWGDKTPLNVNYLELIVRVFPDARFIHMIRDGVDVVHSWNKREIYRKSIVKPANRWCSAITSAKQFSQKFPDKIIEIRYEDLVRKPAEEAKKVCDFVKIPFQANMLEIEQSSIINDLEKYEHYKNALKSISEEHVGKGRRNLTKHELEKLGNLINDQLIELGYKPL